MTRPSDLSVPSAKMILVGLAVFMKWVIPVWVLLTVRAVLIESRQRLCRGPVPTALQKSCRVLSIVVGCRVAVVSLRNVSLGRSVSSGKLVPQGPAVTLADTACHVLLGAAFLLTVLRLSLSVLVTLVVALVLSVLCV